MKTYLNRVGHWLRLISPEKKVYRRAFRGDLKSPAFEQLECREMFSVTLSLIGNQSLSIGTNINVSNSAATAESEMTLAINSQNPLNVAAFTSLQGSVALNLYFSRDGGSNWTRNRIRDVGLDGASGNNDDGMGNGNRFDPSIAFDALGRLWIAYGVAVGTSTSLIVARSSDGGATFNQFTTVETRSDTPSGTPGVDKWMLSTGLDPSSGNQAVYVAYTQNQTENVWLGEATDQRIVVRGSNDGGLTFTSARIINDGSIGAGTDSQNLMAIPAVGPDGELYVAWHDVDAGKIMFDNDLDGLWSGSDGFGADVTARTLRRSLFKTTSIGGNAVEAQPNRGIFAGPVLKVDLSNGPDRGALYLAFVDVDSGTDSDIFLTKSTNDGASWTSRGLVEMTANDSSTDFLPWLAVDPYTGSVNVLYYTTNGDQNTGDNDVWVWLASSFDGGANFTGTALTTARSRASAAVNSNGNDFLEYIGLDVVAGTAHGFWSDNRGAAPNTFLADLDAYTARASFRSATNANRLTVSGDDSGSFADTITVGRSMLNRSFLEVRVNNQLQFAGLMATVDELVINAGVGSDIIQVLTDLGDISLTINGQSGNDTIDITPGVRNLDGFLGPVTISGGTGTTNRLNIFDQANSYNAVGLSNLYTVSALSTTRFFANPVNPLIPSLAVISYANVQAIDLRTGAGADLITASANSGTALTVSSGSGNDGFRVANTAANITLNGGSGSDIVMATSVSNHQFRITGSNRGDLDANVQFTSVEGLTGNSQVDRFVFSAGATVTGALDGRSGNDTVDYSLYLTSIGVDLNQGLATGTGSILSIENVLGGTRSDVIIGDSRANILRGGAGRDLVIGGTGADTIYGDGGQDLLISGTTDHAGDAVALLAIMSEWNRDDQTYAERIDHLRHGGGNNGQVVLDWTTVDEDNSIDTLYGGGLELDWFFVSNRDRMPDLVADEAFDRYIL